MNMAYAKLPVSFGGPYSAKAVLLSTPPVNTSETGYDDPSADRSLVDMNGCDCAFHPLP